MFIYGKRNFASDDGKRIPVKKQLICVFSLVVIGVWDAFSQQVADEPVSIDESIIRKFGVRPLLFPDIVYLLSKSGYKVTWEKTNKLREGNFKLPFGEISVAQLSQKAGEAFGYQVKHDGANTIRFLDPDISQYGNDYALNKTTQSFEINDLAITDVLSELSKHFGVPILQSGVVGSDDNAKKASFKVSGGSLRETLDTVSAAYGYSGWYSGIWSSSQPDKVPIVVLQFISVHTPHLPQRGGP